MLLVGSRALAHLLEIDRVPVDFDFIASIESISSFVNDLRRSADPPVLAYPFADGKKYLVRTKQRIYEFEVAWLNSTGAFLLQHVHDTWHSVTEDGWPCPSLDVLYALKMSHRYLKNSPHFKKTMVDILQMRAHGAQISSELREWFISREQATYTYKHPKLNVKKAEFFNPNEGIDYVYDHDSIHIAMQHAKKPAYSFFKADEAEVYTSRFLFEQLPTEVQLWSVLEETQVLALERSQVPFKGKVEPRRSFDMAHEKVCTSITSGWWREFAWEHFAEVQAMYEPDYVYRFWAAVDNGTVKEFKR